MRQPRCDAALRRWSATSLALGYVLLRERASLPPTPGCGATAASSSRRRRLIQGRKTRAIELVPARERRSRAPPSGVGERRGSEPTVRRAGRPVTATARPPHRAARQPRHPRPLRRLRDADGGARRRGWSSAASRSPSTAAPTRRRASSTEHRGARARGAADAPHQAPRHAGPHPALRARTPRGERFDAALVVNSANALFVPLLRAAGIPVALHVDGIEQRRAKWGPFGRAVYAALRAARLRVADELITDAEVIRAPLPRALRRRRRRRSPTASSPSRPPGTEVLRRLGLEPRRYFLYVSRFEPENNPHRVAEAYRGVRGRPAAGDGGRRALRRRVHRTASRRGADPRILFPGADLRRGLPRAALATPSPTSTPPRSAAPTRRWSRRWATATAWWSTTRPRTARSRARPGSTSRPRDPETLAAALDGLRSRPGASARTRGRAAAARAARALLVGARSPTGTRRCFRRLTASRG